MDVENRRLGHFGELGKERLDNLIGQLKHSLQRGGERRRRLGVAAAKRAQHQRARAVQLQQRGKDGRVALAALARLAAVDAMRVGDTSTSASAAPQST
jgi:hypothetical protein